MRITIQNMQRKQNTRLMSKKQNITMKTSPFLFLVRCNFVFKTPTYRFCPLNHYIPILFSKPLHTVFEHNPYIPVLFSQPLHIDFAHNPYIQVLFSQPLHTGFVHTPTYQLCSHKLFNATYWFGSHNPYIPALFSQPLHAGFLLKTLHSGFDLTTPHTGFVLPTPTYRFCSHESCTYRFCSHDILHTEFVLMLLYIPVLFSRLLYTYRFCSHGFYCLLISQICYFKDGLTRQL